MDGIEWVQTLKNEEGDPAKLVKRARARLPAREISGKLGVVGLGAIGILVANAAKSLGMEVLPL